MCIGLHHRDVLRQSAIPHWPLQPLLSILTVHPNDVLRSTGNLCLREEEVLHQPSCVRRRYNQCRAVQYVESEVMPVLGQTVLPRLRAAYTGHSSTNVRSAAIRDVGSFPRLPPFFRSVPTHSSSNNCARDSVAGSRARTSSLWSCRMR